MDRDQATEHVTLIPNGVLESVRGRARYSTFSQASRGEVLLCDCFKVADVNHYGEGAHHTRMAVARRGPLSECTFRVFRRAPVCADPIQTVWVQVACRTDDLSYDVLHNRIIKSTLERLARTRGIAPAQRDEVVTTVRGLAEITSTTITLRDFGRIQLHGNNAFYGLLMRVCALVHEALVPEPGEGRFRFRDVLADPQTMGYIFQDFVRIFFSIEQKRFSSVKSEQISWPIMPGIGQGHFLFPTMNTDVSLFSGSRTIIIECKWTTNTLQTYRDTKRLWSEHLYQLNAYVRSHARAKSSRETVEGLLLYPLFDEPVDVLVLLDGQWIRARTIDLSVDWEGVHDQLLCLLDPVSPISNTPAADAALVV